MFLENSRHLISCCSNNRNLLRFFTLVAQRSSNFPMVAPPRRRMPYSRFEDTHLVELLDMLASGERYTIRRAEESRLISEPDASLIASATIRYCTSAGYDVDADLKLRICRTQLALASPSCRSSALVRIQFLYLHLSLKLVICTYNLVFPSSIS